MDLKIKDVAELLHVSETTIRRWLNDGKIPAYRMNHQYRFSRTEIEAWVMSQKLGSSGSSLSPFQELSTAEETQKEETPARSGNKQFSLYRAIHKGGVYHGIPGKNKEEVIQATMQLLAKNLNLDADVLSDLLLDREKLMPTALNQGIGVPHTRDFLLNAPYDVVVVAFPEEPIDYGALDGLPVHSLFFLFANKDARHLHLLAKIAHFASLPQALELLQSKPSKEKLLQFVKDWESEVPLPKSATT